MLRGLLALLLLLVAIGVSFLVIAVGAWAGSRVTGIVTLAAACLWLALGGTLVIAIWAGAYAVSPGPTKYLTVFGLTGAILLSLLSTWIVRARDEARRNSTHNNLRQIGLELQRAQDVRPGIEPTFNPGLLEAVPANPP